jgi:hypothetical protein
MFKQNYLNELPDDIQDKIWTIVNKEKFSDCLKQVDNPDMRTFCNLYNMINDPFFDISYEICDGELGWFHKATDAEIDEDKNYAYEMYQRDRCLSWKNYTKREPEYKDIRYYSFSYMTRFGGYNKNALKDINKSMKKYVKDTNLKLVDKVIFTKNDIHIYFADMYREGNATHIAYNLIWGYNLIFEMFQYLELDTDIAFGFSFEYHANHRFLEDFDIKKKVVIPFFGS